MPRTTTTRPVQPYRPWSEVPLDELLAWNPTDDSFEDDDLTADYAAQNGAGWDAPDA